MIGVGVASVLAFGIYKLSDFIEDMEEKANRANEVLSELQRSSFAQATRAQRHVNLGGAE